MPAGEPSSQTASLGIRRCLAPPTHWGGGGAAPASAGGAGGEEGGKGRPNPKHGMSGVLDGLPALGTRPATPQGQA